MLHGPHVHSMSQGFGIGMTLPSWKMLQRRMQGLVSLIPHEPSSQNADCTLWYAAMSSAESSWTLVRRDTVPNFDSKFSSSDLQILKFITSSHVTLRDLFA